MLWWTTSWRPRLEFCRTSARELYRFASRAFADGQIQFFSTRLDEALVAGLLGVSSLGYYAIAKRLYQTVGSLIYSVLPKVLLAIFSKEQDHSSKLFAKAQRTIGLAATFAFPLFLGAAAIGPLLITALFGERWEASSFVFPILMISGVFLLNQHILHPVFHALGRPGITMRLSALRALISAPLVVVGSSFDLLGISVAVAAGNIIGVCLDVWTASRLEKGTLKPLILTNVTAVAYCLPMLGGVLYMNWLLTETTQSDALLILSISLGAIIYGTTLFIGRAPLLDVISKHVNFQFFSRSKQEN